MNVLQRRHHHPVLVAALCLGWLSACGVPSPKVEKQTSGQIDKPEFPPMSESFKLNESGNTDLNFEGPIIFWSADAQPELLQNTLAQSLEIKEADAKYKELKFQQEALKHEVAGLREKLEQLENEPRSGNIEAKIDNHFREFEPKLAANLEDWFKKRFDPEQAGNFKQYCEATLWQYATSNIVRNFDFTRRPTPLKLCEAFYQESGFFADEACAPAEEGKAKNYFACYWGAGGVGHSKVTLHEVRGGEATAEEKQAVFALFASDAWRSELDEKLRLPLLKMADKRLVLKLDGLLLSKVLQQSPSDFLSRDRETINWEEFLGETHSARGEKLSLHDRIFNVHLLGADAEQRSRFTLSPEQEPALQAFTMQLGGFLPLEKWHREASETAAEEEAAWNARKLTLTEAIAARDAERQKIEEAMQPLQLDWITAKFNSGWYILDKAQADALYPKSFINFKIQGDLVTVTLRMDYVNGGRAKGCFDLARKEAVSCPQDELELEMEQTFQPLAVTFDRETSLLQLKFDVTDAAAFGLKQKEVSVAEVSRAEEGLEHKEEPSYQRWTAEELQGKTIRFELYPRRYKPELVILTGKAFIEEEGGREWSQGSVILSEFGGI